MGDHNLRGLRGNRSDGFEHLLYTLAVVGQKSRKPFLWIPYIRISEDAEELFVCSNADKRKPGIVNDTLIVGMGYERHLPTERLQRARDTHKRMYVAGSADRDNEIVGSGFGHDDWLSDERAGGLL